MSVNLPTCPVRSPLTGAEQRTPVDLANIHAISYASGHFGGHRARFARIDRYRAAEQAAHRRTTAAPWFAFGPTPAEFQPIAPGSIDGATGQHPVFGPREANTPDGLRADRYRRGITFDRTANRLRSLPVTTSATWRTYRGAFRAFRATFA